MAQPEFIERVRRLEQQMEGNIPLSEVLLDIEDPFHGLFAYEFDSKPHNYLDEYQEYALDPTSLNRDIVQRGSNFVTEENFYAIHMVRLMHHASHLALYQYEKMKKGEVTQAEVDHAMGAYTQLSVLYEQYLSQGVTKKIFIPGSINPQSDFRLQQSMSLSIVKNFRYFIVESSQGRVPALTQSSYSLMFHEQVYNPNKSSHIIITKVDPNTTDKPELDAVRGLLDQIETTSAHKSKDQEKFYLPGRIWAFFRLSNDPTIKQLMKTYRGVRQIDELLQSPNTDVFIKNAKKFVSGSPAGDYLFQRLIMGMLLPSYSPVFWPPEHAKALSVPSIMDLTSLGPNKIEPSAVPSKKEVDIGPILRNVFFFQTHMAEKIMLPSLRSGTDDEAFDKSFKNMLGILDRDNIQFLAYGLLQNIKHGPFAIKMLFPDKKMTELNTRYPVYTSLLRQDSNYDPETDEMFYFMVPHEVHQFLPNLIHDLQKRFKGVKNLDVFINALKNADSASADFTIIKQHLGINEEHLNDIRTEEFQRIYDDERAIFLSELDTVREVIQTRNVYNADVPKTSAIEQFNIKKLEMRALAKRNALVITGVVKTGMIEAPEIYIVTTVNEKGQFISILPSFQNNEEPELRLLLESLFLSSLNMFISEFKNFILPRHAQDANKLLDQL